MPDANPSFDHNTRRHDAERHLKESVQHVAADHPDVVARIARQMKSTHTESPIVKFARGR